MKNFNTNWERIVSGLSKKELVHIVTWTLGEKELKEKLNSIYNYGGGGLCQECTYLRAKIFNEWSWADTRKKI